MDGPSYHLRSFMGFWLLPFLCVINHRRGLYSRRKNRVRKEQLVSLARRQFLS
jgi:hypothetical protein